MDFKSLGWEKIVPLFMLAASVVAGLYKFIVWLIERRDKKNETAKKTSAEELKATLEHSVKLEELADKKIMQLMELQGREIDGLRLDVANRDEKILKFIAAEDSRKVLCLKKLFMLREHRREIELFELVVLKIDETPNFKAIALETLETLKNQTEEHEKLLA